MAYTHGIYVNESATSIVAPMESDSAVIIAVGTAPVNMVDQPKINEPVVAYTYAEAVEKMGFSTDFEHYTLCEVVDAAFSKFGVCPIIMINVLDPTEHKTVVAAQEITILNKRAVIQEQGILLKSVVVKDSTGATTYEKDKDYLLSFASDGTVILAVVDDGAIGSAGKIQISYEKLNPSAVTKMDIVGGYDVSTGKYKGLECISQVYPKLGIVPGQIIAPGFSSDPIVAAVMKAKTKEISGLFKATAIADIDSDVGGAESYDATYEWKNKNSYSDENLICCWPMVKIGDVIYRYSTIWAALTAKTDAQNGNVPYVSPSNKALPITGLVTKSGKEIYLDMNQANLLNGYGICTAINLNGWRSWGNNTSVYPSNTDVKDRFISVRRFFSWWGNSFIQTYFQKVDNPMNKRLIEAVIDSENIRANGYVARGMMAGARIEFILSENPVTDLLNGRIRFHQYMTPFPPAETIENTLEFDADMLKTALS